MTNTSNKIFNQSEPTLRLIFDAVNQNFETIFKNFDTVFSTLKENSDQIGVLTQKVDVIQQDVADLKTDMGRVNSHLHSLDERYERLEVMVSSLDQRTQEDTDALTIEVVKIKEHFAI